LTNKNAPDWRHFTYFFNRSDPLEVGADHLEDDQIGHSGNIPDQGAAETPLGAEDETSETIHVGLL
jgi:hypothetical protein